MSALDALLAGTDCVSEWDEWMDVLRVAVWDGQIDLVARETSRPELDEPCGSMTQRELTCGSLATEVAVLAARGDASGAAALFTMLEAHVSEARRDGFVVDAFARRAPPDPS